MPTNLTGSKIKDTYSQLLHVDGGPAASEKVVYSGTGVATALSVGTGSASVDNLKFDGNTILFDVGNNEYIFINRNIESFKSKAKIVKYVYPVGNRGVPYPYAIDEKGNYYLLIEYIIFKNIKYSLGK
jgi:hypothetical protein